MSGALTVEVIQTRPMPLEGGFSCEPGELLALVGPSGAGKTSMLRAIAGLLRPQSGRVTVGQQIWFDTSQHVCLAPQQRHVGLVFQNYALMPHLSAVENVALALLHLPRPRRLARASDWLSRTGLDRDEQSRRPAGLSGGQQQRVAVARALAREPQVLLLDEPFSAVDQMNRQTLYRLLADLKRELEIPTVLVTHDLNEARMLADRLVVMDAGCVQQVGPPDAIYRGPRNGRVADLVGIQNRFKGIWLGADAKRGHGLLAWTDANAPGAFAEPVVLSVRDKRRIEVGQTVDWIIPGDGISLTEHGSVAEGFSAMVTEARHLGEITLVTLTLELSGGIPLRLTLAGSQRLHIAAGQRVGVQLDLGKIHVMPLRTRPIPTPPASPVHAASG